MKVKMFAVFVLFVMVGFGVSALAQQAAPAAEKKVEASAPQFDELDVARLQAVQIAAKRANEACQGLEAVREFNELRAQVQGQIEARYAGFTLDWAAFKLVPKAPAK